MATKQPTAFQRIFSRADLFSGPALKACFWSACSSLLLVVFLIHLFLLIDLLVHNGELRIPAGEQEALTALIGQDVLSGAGTELPVAAGGEVRYVNRGLLPTVWRDRDEIWGSLGVVIYRRVPFLQNDGDALRWLIAFAALIAWLRSMMDSRSRSLLMRVAVEASTRLRKSIHRQTLRLGPSDLEGRSAGQAYHLFTTDVDHVGAGIYHWANRVGRDLLKLVLLVLLAVSVEPQLALILSLPLALCWYVASRERRRAEDVNKLVEARSEKELKLLAEGLERTRLVRGYLMDGFEQQQFEKYLQRYQDERVGAAQTKSWRRRGVRTIVVGLLAFVLWFVAYYIQRHSIELATGWLMLSSFAVTWFPLQNLARLRTEHEQAELAANRIQTYLNLIPEVGQAVGAKFLQPLAKMLSFENVSYTTPSRRQLLDGLSLKIPSGRQVAVISADPLESLAVGYLLPRFIEPQKGKILIDGEDIAWVTLESLRAECIFVGGRDPYLTGTVRDNIGGGNPNFSLTEITDAAKIAHAHNFILKLPQGYETVIGEHGEQLDAGQSYRMGLARAILRKPALLIIEEPDSALDDDTKAMLDDAYSRIAKGRTVIYLAQRLSTIKRCDEILFLNKGRLAAIGHHSRLVQSSKLYRHWEYVRFSEFRHEFEAE